MKESRAAERRGELVPIGRFDLVPANPSVQTIARAFHWKPNTVIVRIERALPTKFEQQVYLTVASDFRIHPESLAKLLHLWRGEHPLQLSDLEYTVVAPHIVSSRFGNFVRYLEACLSLLKIVSMEYNAFPVTVEFAGMIVLAYGSDEPERLIELIDAQLEECCEVLGIGNNHSYSVRMRLCVWVFVTKIIPYNRAHGLPDILDLSDFFEYGRGQRAYFRSALDETLPDWDGEAEFNEIKKEGGFK